MTAYWKKIVIITLDIAVATYLVIAITAFNKPDEKATVCSEVDIDITQGVVDGFLNTKEVKTLLEKQHIYPMAQEMKLINTRTIEETLEQSPFVENAECYKTQSGHVRIKIDQRMPVMRVMANSGDTYYIDDLGEVLPATRYASNVPVATGWISRKYAKNILAEFGKQILADRFWLSQTEQINVLFDGSIELVPRVGEHIAFLGPPVNLPKKLERLRKFYKYGLSHAGWNKYEHISVEFDNQIICKKAKQPNQK